MRYQGKCHQAIRTEYKHDANGNPYLTASCDGKRIRRPRDYGVDVLDAHYQTAIELCQLLDWPTDIVGGSLPGKAAAYAWVQK